MNQKFIAIFLLLLSFILGFNCRKTKDISHSDSFSQKQKSLQILVQRVNERLAWMKDVAAYKWENDIPIEDKAREVVVIASSQKAVLETSSLDTTSTRRFFELQIKMAKKVQQDWHTAWTLSGFNHKNYRDLTTEVRPELLRLGKEIIEGINTLKPWTFSPREQRRSKKFILQKMPSQHLNKANQEALLDQIFQVKPKE